MIIDKLDKYARGWVIGDFQPSILQTPNFEVGIMYHPSGQKIDYHYHEKITEYNVLISGKMKIQDTIIDAGTIFILPPYEIADPIFMENSIIVCVKTPSIPTDKCVIPHNEN